MSGGSMDYAYYHVREIADIEEDPLIANLLYDLAEYLHDEEWYRSADYGKDQYIEAKRKFKKKWFSEQVDIKPYVDAEIKKFKHKIYEMIEAEMNE